MASSLRRENAGANEANIRDEKSDEDMTEENLAGHHEENLAVVVVGDER